VDKGWVKLHRNISENVFLQKDNNAYLVFTKLLYTVSKSKGEWAGGRIQLGELMNMNPRTLYDVLKRLESQHMIKLNPNTKYSVITICNWHKYQSSPTAKSEEGQLQPNNNPTTTQHSNKNKNKTKNNTTNVVLAKPEVFGKPEINEMFDFWEKTIGYKIQARIKPNRFACSNLLKKHGPEKVQKLILGVAQTKTDRYAPAIADFCDLQAKFNQLIAWGHKRESNTNLTIIPEA